MSGDALKHMRAVLDRLQPGAFTHAGRAIMMGVAFKTMPEGRARAVTRRWLATPKRVFEPFAVRSIRVPV